MAQNPTAPSAGTSSSLVTAAQIQAAAQTVLPGKKIVVVGGRTARSIEELQSVVRQLSRAGRLDDEATILLAEEDEISQARLALNAAVEKHVLSRFSHTLEQGPANSRAAGMVRDVYASDWRQASSPDGSAEAESTAAVAVETEDVTSSAAPHSETPLPADFPGRDLLIKAGFSTMEAVNSLSSAELETIRGIGKATSQAIVLAVQVAPPGPAVTAGSSSPANTANLEAEPSETSGATSNLSENTNVPTE